MYNFNVSYIFVTFSEVYVVKYTHLHDNCVKAFITKWKCDLNSGCFSQPNCKLLVRNVFTTEPIFSS